MSSQQVLSPTEASSALIIAARACINCGEPVLGAQYATEAYHSAEDVGDYRQMGLALLERGVCMFVMMRNEEAEDDYSKGLRLVLQYGTAQDESRFRVNLGNLYSRTERHVEAVKEYERALELTQQSGDVLTRAKILTNISSFFGTILNDYRRAIDHCNEAIAAYESLHDSMGLGKAYANLGLFLSRCGDVVGSLAAHEQALKYKLCGSDTNEIVVSYYNIVASLAHLNRLQEARATYAEMSSCVKNQSNEEPCRRYLELAHGTLLYYEGRLSEAVTLWERVRDWMQSMAMHEDLRLVSTFLAEAYERQGNAEKAAELLRFVFEYEDSTARKRAAHRLSYVAATYKLEQERARAEIERLRNVELLEAVKRRQELNHNKERFLAFIAHELKEPLASASSITSVLLRDDTLTPDERQEFRCSLTEVVERMNALVSSLVKQRTLVRQKTIHDVSDVWGRDVRMWNSRAAAKRITLTLTKEEQPVWVEATEQQLLTIIDNLISNAVKYTQQFGTVRVAIRAVTHDDVPFAELTVTDTGPGIRTEDMGRLFQPWQTLSAVPTGNETSTGLGLYFVKCEVDALGGSVSCDSQVGVGTTFRVKLPVAYDIRSREVA